MLDQPPPPKPTILERLSNAPPLDQRQADRLRRRLKSWRTRPSWLLWEACDVTFGLIPVPVLRHLTSLTLPTDSDMLCEQAWRAILASDLKTLEREGRYRNWVVRSSEFARWVQAQTKFVGIERGKIFAEIFPTEEPSQELKQARREVLSSEYSTPELDAALEAIAKFWLPLKDGDEPPNYKLVIDWLMSERHLSKNAAERVDTLIRRPDAKAGGRKRTPQKAQ